MLAMTFLVLSVSLMNTIWLNTAGECYAQTLSDARISPRMCGARTFHEQYNQPLQYDAPAT
jgi:hypothetical protein